MARNFLTGLRLVNLPSDPPTGSEGELYYNTVTDKIRLYSNGAWIDVVAASSGSLFNVDAIAYPDYIAFDTTPELSSTTPGTIFWNDGDGSLDLILKGGNVTIPLGQEICSLVYNAEATTLNPGEAVYMFGAQGQRVSVKRASNAADETSAKTFGLVAESIPAGTEGFVMVHGIVKNLNTNIYNEGDQLYVGTSPGTLTSTKPVGPQHTVFIGVVVKKSLSAGRIFVKAQNGYEIDELHNVSAQSPSNNDILKYVSASTIWVNQNLATAITEVDGAGSGIDADLLDGQHGSYYQNAGNINAGTLAIARGGTSLSSTPSNGQILIGNGTSYTLSTLTAGSNITITNGSGTITISSNTSGGSSINEFFLAGL